MNAIALSDATAGSRYCICEIKEENRLVNRLSSMVLLCESTIEACQNHKKTASSDICKRYTCCNRS